MPYLCDINAIVQLCIFQKLVSIMIHVSGGSSALTRFCIARSELSNVPVQLKFGEWCFVVTGLCQCRETVHCKLFVSKWCRVDQFKDCASIDSSVCQPVFCRFNCFLVMWFMCQSYSPQKREHWGSLIERWVVLKTQGVPSVLIKTAFLVIVLFLLFLARSTGNFVMLWCKKL